MVCKALNPSIVNGIVFAGKWFHEMLAIDNPMPTGGTPVRLRRPVVNLVGLCVELAASHTKIVLLFPL